MTAAVLDLDRWADDGGPPADGGPGFPPLIVTITADATAFYEALGRAVRQAADMFQQLAAAICACGKAVARAFHRGWRFDVPCRRWRDRPASDEPKIDRARRLRVDRQMRARARRAACHGRVLR